MKKYIILLASVFVVAIGAIASISVMNSNKSQEYFATSGYVLGSDASDKITFAEKTAFNASTIGVVHFQDAGGSSAKMSEDSFVHLDDGSVMALSDGVLLDFNDLSSNFINNYYTTRTFSIADNGGDFVAQTESGALTFGEHMWKLSNNKYMIRAAGLKVHFSDTDVQDAGDYIEVCITEDGIVQMQSEQNTWMTISESCYIETANGVRINPVTKIIQDDDYQITVNKLVVSPDDSIVLTEDETRRQIVPEINIEAVDGEDGEGGISGEDGTEGEGGTEGSVGEEGTSGTNGGSGVSGALGEEGTSGSNGTKGVDATTESSVNTSLATMSITDWNVTGTSLQATLLIGGGVETLDVAATASNTYNGKITITNVETGEEVFCYQTDEKYPLDSIVSADKEITKHKNGVENLYFTTLNPDSIGGTPNIDVLTPDTQYKLSVWAYYEVNNNVYYREFLSRNFYTDTTGVQLSQKDATTNSITVQVAASQAGMVDLYLLTEEQNESFSLGQAGDSSMYVMKSDNNAISFAENGGTQDYTFKGVPSDAHYIVRAVITDTNQFKTLPKQALDVHSLKTIATWDDKPTAYYNRVNGSFEVYRPVVSDPDDGVVKYVYTAYQETATAGKYEKYASKTIYPTDPEPVLFVLPSDVTYYFGVEMYFDDNEKVTIYESEDSEPIKTSGSSMPGISWAALDVTTEYNHLSGLIKLTLDGSSTINTDKPLFVSVYADQVIDQEFKLDNESDEEKGDGYSVKYNKVTSSEIYIAVDLEDLYRNTNYTFTIMGSIDFDGAGDDNTEAVYNLGMISARTYDTNKIIVQSVAQAGGSGTDSMSLSIQMNPALMAEGSEIDYVKNQLSEGRVTLSLYKGSGSSKTALGNALFTPVNDVEDFYDGTGKTITERDFGVSLSAGQTYTVTIDEVVDGTYNLGKGYLNTFTPDTTSIVVAASVNPPDLSTEPQKEVKATPILNEDAPYYGAVYDETLPDDTVIGYVLQSQYDNSQRLAKTVTYYAFEYREFYSTAVSLGEDPIETAEILKEMTVDTPNTENELPAVAIFFEDVEFASGALVEGSTANNCYLYQGTTASGRAFTRGYAYVFAYTVEYSISSNATTSTYPYDFNKTYFEDYKNTYGCGLEGKTWIGLGKAYVLNSGMVLAPKTTPKFYSYLASDDGKQAIVHYSWIDIDGAVSTKTGQETQIVYNDNTGNEAHVKVNDSKIPNTNGWYELVINYDAVINEHLLSPEVQVSDYVNSYEDILQAVWENTYENEVLYLAQIPVEGELKLSNIRVDDAQYVGKIVVEMDTKHLEDNYIDFRLGKADAGSDSFFDLMAKERAYALELTITPVDKNSKIDKKIFYMPITTTTTTAYARLSTALLTDYLEEKQGFSVEAKLYYDNAEQGWSLIGTETLSTAAAQNLFALQRTNKIDEEEVIYEHGSYYTALKGLYGNPNAALLTSITHKDTSDFMEALRATIPTKNSDDVIVDGHVLPSDFAYKTNSQTIRRALSVQPLGVQDSTASDYDTVSGMYMIPKGVAVYDVTFGKSSNIATLDSITPTVGSRMMNTGVDSVQFTAFTIDGASQIKEEAGARYVNIRLYSTEKDAENLSEDPEKCLHVLKIKLTEEGKIDQAVSLDGKDIVFDPQNPHPAISGLNANAIYYYTFSAVIGENGNEERLLLDRADATLKAVYSFETIDGLRITPSGDGVQYYNFSYEDKTLNLQYSLNETYEVSATYDIYTNAAVQQDTDTKEYALKDNPGAPLMSHDYLVNNALLTPSALNYNSNVVSIKLKPDVLRNMLVPGNTYYLCITVQTPSGVGTDVEVLPFTIDGAGNVMALVSAGNVTQDSLTYTVSIIDKQYSLMNDSTEDPAQYIVRFTDKNGKRIYTSYDNDTYDVSAQRSFTLDTANLNQNKNPSLKGNAGSFTLEQETPYTITVYAVKDLDHDGLSNEVSAIDPTSGVLTNLGKKGTDYFSAVETNVAGANYNKEWGSFLKFVDSFWNETTGSAAIGANVAELDACETLFSMGSKSTTTADDKGYILNNGVKAEIGPDSTIAVSLTNSYGVVKPDGTTQAFQKIEYTLYSQGDSGDYFTGESIYNNTTQDGDAMFVIDDSYVIPRFIYTIPQTVSSLQTYDGTILLYVNETDTVPAGKYEFST